MSAAKPRFNYLDACMAMQAGVTLDVSLNAPNLQPKHLRVGVNSSLCDSSALAKLLIRKGVISEAEYVDAITREMNDEVERYEKELSARLGKRVTLSPGVANIENAPDPKVAS